MTGVQRSLTGQSEVNELLTTMPFNAGQTNNAPAC
jgi:hypothetical protein